MRIFLTFFGYLGVCLTLSALISPWLHGQLGDLVALTPDRLLYRFAMLLALLGLPWLLRFLQLNTRVAIGFDMPRRTGWHCLVTGLGLGILILGVLSASLLLIDARVLALPAGLNGVRLLKLVFGGLISGLAVGLIEETFFRGMLHSGMRRSLGFWPSAMAISTLYAGLHFIRPGRPTGEEFDVAMAFGMLGEGLARLGDWMAIGDSFIALLLAGLLLSMVRERNGHILWNIGIHTGWVMVIKLTKHLSNANPDSGAGIWIGSYDQIIGWLAALWLAVLCTLYWHLSRPAGHNA